MAEFELMEYDNSIIEALNEDLLKYVVDAVGMCHRLGNKYKMPASQVLIRYAGGIEEFLYDKNDEQNCQILDEEHVPDTSNVITMPLALTKQITRLLDDVYKDLANINGDAVAKAAMSVCVKMLQDKIKNMEDKMYGI